jgi:hypothetical protein
MNGHALVAAQETVAEIFNHSGCHPQEEMPKMKRA